MAMVSIHLAGKKKKEPWKYVRLKGKANIRKGCPTFGSSIRVARMRVTAMFLFVSKKICKFGGALDHVHTSSNHKKAIGEFRYGALPNSRISRHFGFFLCEVQ